MSDVPADSSDETDQSNDVFGHARSAVAADLGIVAAVGAVLVVVQSLPPSVHASLVFDYGAFDVPTLLTAAYVHSGPDHLFSNLGGYLSLAVTTYLVCLQADRRTWFRRTFPLFVLVLPIAVNLTSYAILETRFPTASPISRGFSGVVAGFGGFLLVAVVVHLRQTYSRETAFFVGQFAVVVFFAELLWIYRRGLTPVQSVAVGGGLVLAVLGIASRARGTRLDGDHYQRVGFDLCYLSLVLALLVWLMYGLFPANPIAHGTFTNVFAHGAGFVEGGLLAALTDVTNPPDHR